jgi:DNA gyrase subunit B
MSNYLQSEFSLPTLRERMRDHPGMYIGRKLDQAGLHFLLGQVLSEAVDPGAMNSCTKLHATIRADGSLQVEDNGRGLPIGPFEYGANRLPIEDVLSVILFNHPNQQVYTEFGFLVLYGPMLNAVSSRLIVDTQWQGTRYGVDFTDSEVTQPLHSLGATPASGTMIDFMPDIELFSEQALKLELLETYVTKLAEKQRGAEFVLKDERSGVEARFNSG